MKKFFLGPFIALGLINSVQAMQIDSKNPIITSVAINSSSPQGLMGPQRKEVAVMRVYLTAQEKQKMMDYIPAVTQDVPPDSSLPSKADTGMNKVPVLDQGLHGSCATFATTAAIDALLGKGDYVSQLCQLELGSYLETRSYLSSGWDGSTGDLVFNQMAAFGIVNKDMQRSNYCSGVREYPRIMVDRGRPMSLEDFKRISEDISKAIVLEPILTAFQRFYSGEPDVSEKTLAAIKKALATPPKGTSVKIIMSTYLLGSHCDSGACARYHQAYDTWAMTKEIRTDRNPQFGAHEMIIIGYDDNAEAVDGEGKQHKGLLILRNSWGPKSGDNGNYYMTYGYFKQFVMDAHMLLARGIS